jgi:hypothetical protein
MLKYKVTPESSASLSSSLFSSPDPSKSTAGNPVHMQQRSSNLNNNVTSQQDELYSDFITTNLPTKSCKVTAKNKNTTKNSSNYTSKSGRRVTDVAVIKIKREPPSKSGTNRNSFCGNSAHHCQHQSGGDYSNLNAAKSCCYYSNVNLSDLSAHRPNCKKMRHQVVKRKTTICTREQTYFFFLPVLSQHS